MSKNLPVADIIRQYLNEDQSSPQISERYGTDATTIRNLLRANGIAIRSAAEAVRIARQTGRRNRESEMRHIQAMLKVSKERFGKGALSPNWKGGRRKRGNGYISLYQPLHPRADKAGYVLEHRLVMEQRIRRYLSLSEHVHHINGIKDDNKPENLMLLSLASHRLTETICKDCPLKKEIRLVQFQNKQLLEQVRQLNLKFMKFACVIEEAGNESGA